MLRRKAVVKRVVLVLEISDDEAEIVIEAVGKTQLRFAGFPMNEMARIAADGAPNFSDGTHLAHFVSEGANYLGAKPLNLTGLLSR
jgi:hypothetical protein